MKAMTLLLAAVLAPPASAVEYRNFQADKSSLGFVSHQMNVPVDGSFATFTGSMTFDPAHPTEGSASLEVQVASIDAGSDEANDELATKNWFDSKAFPTASFVSTGVKPLGGNRYQISGRLTIKGQTRDVTTIASFQADGRLGVFQGNFSLLRADYGLGGGIWADYDTVANEIQIRFRIAATVAN